MMTKSRKQPHQSSSGGVHACAPTQAKAINAAIIAREHSFDESSSRGVRSLDTSNPRPLHVSGLTPAQQAILELVRRSLANRRGCS
jgi:DNA-binding NarL/FixJ family response regulator